MHDRSAGAVQLRSERRREQVFLRAGGRRDSADAPVQRHGVLSRRRRCLAGRADPVAQGSTVPFAGLAMARHDGALLPEWRVVVSATRCVRPACALQIATRLRELGAGRGGVARWHRGGYLMTPVESVVQAVLYEGYMLYPYRPSSVKNRQRWTF